MLGTLRSWVTVVERTLLAEGLDEQTLARRLPYARTGQRLGVAEAAAIWEAVDTLTADPVFGLTMLRHLDYADAEELGLAMLAPASGEELLRRIVAYHHLVSDAVDLQLRTSASVGVVTITLRPGTHWRAAEATAGLVVRVLRARFSSTIAPVAVTLGFSNPAGSEAYRRFFRCSPVVGSSVTTLTFARERLPIGQPSDDQGLRRRVDELLASRASRLVASDSLRAAVHTALVATLSDSPTLEQTAHHLHQSPRTLQRQLQREGTTYAAVLDDARCDLATAWIADGRLSRSQMSHLLGFAHPSSFSRALGRWSKRQPQP